MTIFVDTNVLVYARDTIEPDKRARAKAWLEALWRSGSGRLSFQVLQEYYVTVTKKLSVAMPVADARADIQNLLAWRPVTIDGRIMAGAWQVQDRFRLSFWDALIVASAKAGGADRLLTEDLSDGQTFDGLLVVDPFRHEPESH